MKGKAVILAVAAIVIAAGASAGTYSGGTGTAEEPYQIRTAEQMNTIGANPDDWGKSFILMADIDLVAYSGTQYNRIGNTWSNPFTGTFDGNGHVIRNLTFTTSDKIQYVGLFGYTSEAFISNLGIENANISSSGSNMGCLVGYQDRGTIYNCNSSGSISGQKSSKVGGLVGYQMGGTINRCFSACSLTARGFTHEYGGLVGEAYYGTIIDCYSTGTITGDSTGGGSTNIGGLVGFQNEGLIRNCHTSNNIAGGGKLGGLVGTSWGTIEHSYSTGGVSGGEVVGGLVGWAAGSCKYCYSIGDVSGGGYVGGLIGWAMGTVDSCFSSSNMSGGNVGGLVGTQEDGIISNCFSTGTIVHYGSEGSGGLVGRQTWDICTIINCYSSCRILAGQGQDIGGLIGLGSGVINSFWDIDISGLATSGGGMGLTTEQMKTKSNFVNWARWDFTEENSNGTEDIWRMCADGEDYPRLAWEFARRGDFACPDGTALEDLAMMSFDWTASGIRIYSGGDATGDGRIDLADLAVVAAHWLSEGRQDPVEYEVKACQHDLVPPPGELRFSAMVEGRYIHFSDLIVANCCVERIELTSMVSGGVILLHERELMENLCTCICTFPTTAVLGPFEPGTYTLKVVQSDNYFNHEPYVVGTMEVTID